MKNKHSHAHKISTDAQFFTLLDNKELQQAANLLSNIHIVEACYLLDRTISQHADDLISLLSDDFFVSALQWMNPDLIRLVRSVKGMTSLSKIVSQISNKDTIYYVVEVLNPEDAHEILQVVSLYDRKILENKMNYPKESAGRLMQTNFISILDSWTIKQCIHYITDIFKINPDLESSQNNEFFIVNDKNVTQGTISLSKILISNENEKVSTLKNENFKTISTSADQEEVAFLFRSRGLSIVGVVNDNNNIIGVISIQDIIDVVYQENEEDLSLISGAGNIHRGFKTVFQPAFHRLGWLSFNLIEAVTIPAIVLMFHDVMTKYVVIAALIQFVVALGGNTGMQSLSVTIRGLSLKRISSSNAVHHIAKELLIALINACIIGIIGYFWGIVWGKSGLIGIVAFLAVFINVILGVIFGTMYPLLFKMINVDPAVASSVCVTTSNDVVGFFIVLYVAELILM